MVLQSWHVRASDLNGYLLITQQEMIFILCGRSNLKSAYEYIGLAYFHTPTAHSKNKKSVRNNTEQSKSLYMLYTTFRAHCNVITIVNPKNPNTYLFIKYFQNPSSSCLPTWLLWLILNSLFFSSRHHNIY